MTIKSLKAANYDEQDSILLVENFVDSALAHRASGAHKAADVLDSVTSERSVKMPVHLEMLLDKMPEDQRAELLGAVLDGCDEYEARHGEAPRADMIAAALQSAAAGLDPKDIKGRSLLDSATSTNHDQISLQPNRAIVGLYRTIAEAIPFAGYLPVDIGSNEARIIIAQTRAGSSFGGYLAGDSLEGDALGRDYSVSSRYATLTIDGGAGPFTTQFRTRVIPATGEPDSASAALGVLRGRTNIYVSGIPAGGENRDASSTSTTSPLNGNVTLAGVVYTLTGTVNPATGAVSLSSSPALPAGTNAYVEAYVDFDNQPALIPLVSVEATTYKLFAAEARVATSNAFSSASQMRNEAGLDPETLATVKFADLHTQERHYKFLRQARIQGLAMNAGVFNANFPNRGTQLVYSDVIRDLAATLGLVDQKMAILSKDSGISHIYTGARMGAIFDGCPDYIWKPSGINKRPGIYFLGTLFGKYKVYYTPFGVVEAGNGNTSELLCIGTSDQPARNAFMLGDAVPATFLPLATLLDLKRQSAYYTRDITSMNPHVESALRCAVITINNLNPA
ncbi:hypothetical protein [Nevskia ramosa]|uniref:hypothetical protein n=1 Tax=Nevskia ramosa TaxID=64002 RepID=UPI003D105AF3